jgi:DNA mismatch repair ATPase MutS
MKAEFYTTQAANFQTQVDLLKKRENQFVLARVLSVVFGIVAGWLLVWYASLPFFVLFFWLIKRHDALVRDRVFVEELQLINVREAEIIHTHKSPYSPGAAYLRPNHAYASDLDLFTPHGVFSFLNRCSTPGGEVKLASWLNSKLPASQILTNQACIRELATEVEWRQQLQAAGANLTSQQKQLNHFLTWIETELEAPKKWQQGLVIILPLLTMVAAVLAILYPWSYALQVVSLLFSLNLTILGFWFKNISAVLGKADKVHQTLHQFHRMSTMAAKANFTHPHLQSLQKKECATDLHHLAKQFEKLESIQNFVITIFFNGLALYHLRVYFNLIAWKSNHAIQLRKAIDSISELEALSSLANFACNHPEYAFPELNDEGKISFENLSHPLIAPSKAVANSISFQDHRFVILTGSNMSGKSTFLRALGVNMVLANCGSCVAASAAQVQSMDVLVTMRLDDSLEDSTSYFYAETLRLQEVIHHLKEEKSFVLLDEILRGTNSDDKRYGTVAVIEQMVRKHAIGVIATHDLEVCSVTNQHPEVLCNKCFEVHIEGNEMTFDYKLKEGICKNKSASFIMHKLGIMDNGQ